MFDEEREAGDTFQFYVSRLRNSISQSPVKFEIVSFVGIEEFSPSGEPIFSGIIDRGDALLQA